MSDQPSGRVSFCYRLSVEAILPLHSAGLATLCRQHLADLAQRTSPQPALEFVDHHTAFLSMTQEELVETYEAILLVRLGTESQRDAVEALPSVLFPHLRGLAVFDPLAISIAPASKYEWREVALRRNDRAMFLATRYGVEEQLDWHTNDGFFLWPDTIL